MSKHHFAFGRFGAAPAAAAAAAAAFGLLLPALLLQRCFCQRSAGESPLPQLL
jgi:hypothetical protein